MSSIPANLPLRNDLIGEEPYGAPQLDVPVCLNVNENPYAPDPAVCDTIAKRVREIAPTLNRYPDREHIELRQAFSDYLARESGTRLDVDELWGANGSNEIMLQLFQAFGGPGRTALGADPTYSMYPEYARDTFTGWKLAHRNADFTLNVDKVLEAIAEVKPSMVLLTSPTTRPALRCRWRISNVFSPPAKPLKWSARARACIRFSSSTKRTWNSASPAPRAP